MVFYFYFYFYFVFYFVFQLPINQGRLLDHIQSTPDFTLQPSQHIHAALFNSHYSNTFKHNQAHSNIQTFKTHTHTHTHTRTRTHTHTRTHAHTHTRTHAHTHTRTHAHTHTRTHAHTHTRTHLPTAWWRISAGITAFCLDGWGKKRVIA